MQQTLRPLVILAALAGGMFVVAGQPSRAPQTVAVVHKPAQVAPATKAAPPQRSSTHRKLHRTPPKIEKHKWEPPPKRPKVKQRARPLPSCAAIRARRDSMTWAEQLAAYSKATPEEIAHGRRCLGL